MDWVPLPAPINPLAAVRRTTAQVVERAVHVSLNTEAVARLAKVWATEGGAGGAGVGWNESGWHYSEDAAAGGTLTCQYVFVLGKDSHYCFLQVFLHGTVPICSLVRPRVSGVVSRAGRGSRSMDPVPFCDSRIPTCCPTFSQAQNREFQSTEKAGDHTGSKAYGRISCAIQAEMVSRCFFAVLLWHGKYGLARTYQQALRNA